jgi:hypothetical protein
MKIHYSELDLFLQCPAAYRDRYILGKKDEKESSALHIGSALHAAIKAHFDGLNAEEIFLLYWDSMRDVDMIYYRHGFNDLRELGIRWLQLFIKMHAHKFTDFKMEELVEAEIMPGIFIEGTFDMCGLYDGVLTLTDWKTSSRAYSKDKILKNAQMYMYAHMYSTKYGAIPINIQYKVFRKDNGGIQTESLELTPKNMARQMNNVRDIIKLMIYAKQNNVYPHSFSCYCKELT